MKNGAVLTIIAVMVAAFGVAVTILTLLNRKKREDELFYDDDVEYLDDEYMDDDFEDDLEYEDTFTEEDIDDLDIDELADQDFESFYEKNIEKKDKKEKK